MSREDTIEDYAYRVLGTSVPSEEERTMSEVKHAYARLKREWPGLALRQHQPRSRGVQDFTLIYEGTVIFAEVKWLDVDKPATLTRKQAQHLDVLRAAGASACVLAWDDTHKLWVIWRGPFMHLTEQSLNPGHGLPWGSFDSLRLSHHDVKTWARGMSAKKE